MRVATKWVCGLLIAVTALTGPLMSRAAVVQAAELSSGAAPVDADVSDGDRVGAAFLNVAYVPGKAIVCGLGTVASAVVMVITLGSGYRAAVSTFKEGCSGDWILTPEHVSGQIPPKDDVE
ncbi:MAG TPA: hypothetical protein VN323_07035 [Candidatus Dormibacteraeota bacterium]|jgi:hypothetical protein|nr:hypothetical protein [Candidatus Dormibacteraeota bacterium]